MSTQQGSGSYGPWPYYPKEGAQPQAAAVPWKGADVFKGVLLVVGAVVLVLIVTSSIAAATDIDSSALGLGLTALVDVLLVFVAWRFSVKKYGVSWKALGFRRWQPEEAKWAVPAGVLVSLTVAAIYSAILTGLGLDDDVRPPSVFEEPSTGVLIAASVMAVAVAPLVEETFFRGFVFSGLRSRFSTRKAALASSALFALAHISPVTYLPIFIIGNVLSWVYVGTGSLVAPMLVHGIYNGIIVGLSLAL